MAKPTKLPEWDTTQVNSIEPDQDHKDQGWLAPGGIPEKPPFQTFNWWQNNVHTWVKELNIKGVLGYDAITDYVANLSYVVGSDGIIYQCKIANGPASSVVDPVGDTTRTWKKNELDQIISVSASVAANALTVGLTSGNLYFRNATLTNGAAESIDFPNLSLVVPSGATLGTINAIESNIILLAINNAGTIELAVINLAGGNDLSETGLISTTAISAAADSNDVAYSVVARTSVPYRVVGVAKSTQATAGTWATSPTLVQGSGGNALAAMSSIGYGQAWQSVSGSRSLDTLYYNTTGKPIMVAVSITGSSGLARSGTLTVDGVNVIFGFGAVSATQVSAQLAAIVPPGSSYQVVTTNSPTVQEWSELR